MSSITIPSGLLLNSEVATAVSAEDELISLIETPAAEAAELTERMVFSAEEWEALAAEQNMLGTGRDSDLDAMWASIRRRAGRPSYKQRKNRG